MQCNACGSKWESRIEMSDCPFCGQSLKIAKDPDYTDISDVIAYVISIRGIEILKNTKIVSAYVGDLFQGNEREKKLFRILCNYNILSTGLKMIDTTDLSQREIIIKAQQRILMEEAFLPEQIAMDAMNILLKGIGIGESVREKTENKSAPKPAAQPTPKPAPQPASKPAVQTPKPAPKPAAQPTSKPASQIIGNNGLAKPTPYIPRPNNTAKQTPKRIDTYDKYLLALEEFYVGHGKTPLSDAQIEYFLVENRLDREFHITVWEVRLDLIDIYTKHDPARIADTKLFDSNKRIHSYKAYMDELEMVFLRNGRKMLAPEQIRAFLVFYDLRKNYNITVGEVETDLRAIAKRYK